MAELCRETGLPDRDVRSLALQQLGARENRRYKRAERNFDVVKDAEKLVDTTNMPASGDGAVWGEGRVFSGRTHTGWL